MFSLESLKGLFRLENTSFVPCARLGLNLFLIWFSVLLEVMVCMDLFSISDLSRNSSPDTSLVKFLWVRDIDKANEWIKGILIGDGAGFGL